MDFDKKEFYGIVAKAKKQMQITIDQDCNVADTKPDVEKMIQTRGIVKIQETEMMVDRVRIKGEFVFQGLYGTNDTSAYLESLEYSLPFEEYVHIEGVLPSDCLLYTSDYINTESTSEAIAKRTEDHRYVIMKNENIKYTSSYHEKTTVEEGDHVIASLKKTKGKWTISNGLYETDSDDYQTLAVKAYNKNPDVQSIMLKYFVNTDGMMKKFSCNTDGSKVYYQSKKIYDARWNMKKYLTIEEIRNSEKLKQMDHKTSLVDDIEEKTTFKTRKWIMFVIDMAAIVVVIGLLKNRKKKF